MRLLEREPYLQQLEDSLREAVQGAGVFAFLGGEAGVGKTALLTALAQRSKEAVRVVVGACDPLITPRPLGPLLDVAEPLGLEPLLAEGQPRYRIFERLLGELGREATLFIIEDVHWADEATLDLLRYLGRRIDATSALLVASYRDDEVGAQHPLRLVLGDLATARTQRMALPPLSPAAVRELVGGAPIDADELYRQTGGNPFFVTEILAAGAGGIPATVRDAVLARAARLSPSARAVLEAAAVIGARVETELLAEVSGAEMEALSECLRAGMLRPAGPDLAFRHELSRQTILDAIPLPRQQVLHGLVANALRSGTLRSHTLRSSPGGQPDPARLAHHAEGANDAAAVLAYAPLAAERAAALGAHREAAAQYARALRFAERLAPAERASLLEAYSHECAITDQLDEALVSRREAIAIRRQLGDVTRESVDLARLARIFVLSGRNAEGEAAALAAIEVLEGQPPSAALAFAEMNWAYLRMLDRDNEEAISRGRRAIALAEEFDDQLILIQAYNFVGSAMIMSGDAEEGRRLLETSLQLARRGGFDHEAGAAYGNLGSAFGEVYCFEDADRYLAAGIDFCTERDLDFQRLYMSAWQAICHLCQGRWQEAEALATAVLARRPLAAISRIMALLVRGRLRARRGDPDVAEALDEALTLALQTDTLQRLGPVRAARAEAAWLAGEPDRAAAEAAAAFELALAKKHPWFVGELAYWRWKANDPSIDAPARAPAIAAVAAPPYLLQMTGAWREAAAAWRARNCPYEEARALAEGDDEAAHKEALAIFERLGAAPAVQQLRRRLRDQGVKGIPRGPRPSTRANPASLTRRQLQILELLAEGLSNAEIAARLYRSPKTIDHHVSAILAKLEVKNRTEAVREAVQRGVLPPERPSDPD